MPYRFPENLNLPNEEPSVAEVAGDLGGADLVQDSHEPDSHEAKVGDHDGESSSADHVDGHAESAADGEWTVQDAMDLHLSPDHLLRHVQDATYFEIPNLLGKDAFDYPVKLHIPNPSPWSEGSPLVKAQNDFVGPITFQPTKFVVMEMMAALFVTVLFVALGRKMRNGEQVRGRFWNMLEAVVVYVRDEIARPAIGAKDAARFLPFLWTLFFFILTMNLFGMFPLFGAATGSISVTAALAFCVFAVVLGSGTKKMGVVGFWKAQVPHMDLPGAMGYVLIPMIWCIEVFGLFVKHLVLAVRLFANMFAGHLVLAVFVAFIGVTWNTLMAIGVVPAVIGAATAISLLELLVAFIQAYVFTFLSALFIGAAIHPH